MTIKKRDVIVIGAGAAGLFCAAEAGARQRDVEVLDHAKKLGGKILMSGGGRCNFTNMFASPEQFISKNPHFCKSALSRYTQWDFIALVEKHRIDYHEKTLGQLFCNDSAKQIVQLLLDECQKAQVTLTKRCEVFRVDKRDTGYFLETSNGDYECESLVIATGGLSMPRLGASPFGYRIAEQFNIPVESTTAALVPFTLHDHDKEDFSELSGVSVDVVASNDKNAFAENILFTHRGLSGPAALQISSYWTPGEQVHINLLPNANTQELIDLWVDKNKDSLLSTCLSTVFPKRVATMLIERQGWQNKPIKQLSAAALSKIADTLSDWPILPNGTEGYRTAEVTLGGVSTEALSSKTMMAKDHPGLYFIGEVVDVTGWLGGYNFQWAWSSGWAAGQVV